MENENDILKNFPKGDPFKAPEGFFEQFSEEISAKISRRTMPSSLFIKMRQPLKLAASFALLVVFSWLMVLFIQYTIHPSASEQVTISDTLGYEYSFVDEYYASVALSDTVFYSEPGSEEMVDFLLDRNVSYELLADYY